MRVTVSLDETFGETHDVPVGEGFWLVESPANRRLADRLWSAGGRDPNSAVFRRPEGRSDTEVLIGLWETILLHHPDVTEVVIPGYRLSHALSPAVAPFKLVDLGGATRLSL